MAPQDQLTAHFIMQSKGGSGKTYIATQLAQYLKYKGRTPTIVDTDPVNRHLKGFKALNVEELETVETVDGVKRVVEGCFDTLIERICAEERDFLIDSGASNFMPLSAYLLENRGFDTLKSAGRRVVVHTPVGGGDVFEDAMLGFNMVGDNLPEGVNWFVWVNRHFGAVEDEGVAFEKLPDYRHHIDKVSGLIYMPPEGSETFQRDRSALKTARLTYDEALEGAAFGLMARQRFAMMRRAMFEAIDEARLVA